MYMKRKIDDWLVNWKRKKGKSPALVVGIRQCGKTESIENFGKNHYKKIVRVNFWDNPECACDFGGKLTVERIISNLSLRFPETIITPGDTLIFFDEIQECPRARLSFKNFEKDGRFDVIGSGSYLGINGYITGDSTNRCSRRNTQHIQEGIPRIRLRRWISKGRESFQIIKEHNGCCQDCSEHGF